MSEKEIYSRFIDWLDKAWWRLPPSEHRLPSITAFFKPEEAELLTGFPFNPTELQSLAAVKGMEADDLAAKLDALARKGAVWRMQRDSQVLYSLNDAFFIFFSGPFSAIHPDQATQVMAPHLKRYFHDGLMDQLAAAQTKALRVTPINKTIEDPRRILPYEDVKGFVESQDFFAVSRCACRQRKRMDPDAAVCNHPVEVCLHFRELAHYLVENGLARQITREEAKDILHLAADAGLVHAVSNRQQGADTICNCCKCSCAFFESYHVLKHPKSHDFSNYRVRINPATCKACGLCVERCPVQALRLEDFTPAANKLGKAAALDAGQCLGCGVCVHKCPTRSLILERREETHDPPRDKGEWMKRWIADRKQVQK
ncbi:MAG: 4Fe-4S binding protein [Deltaproteobacteria bacterium]|nr:4Fe-4S binding protein [Deltaproteobacteria bacterium]